MAPDCFPVWHTPQWRKRATKAAIALSFLVFSTWAFLPPFNGSERAFLCHMYMAGKHWRYVQPPLAVHTPSRATEQGAPDINVFIPVFNRTNNFDTLASHWRAAIERVRVQGAMRVHLTLVETGTARLFTEAVLAPHQDFLSYIFVPSITTSATFPKAYLYNLAYRSAPRAVWNIFHDYEVLVPAHFLAAVVQTITQSPGLLWAQPYGGREVCYLSEEASRAYQQAYLAHKVAMAGAVLAKHCPPKEKLPAFGAPGGSILVRSDAFEEAGGYESDLFFGYAPEDAFLWSKLSALQPPVYVEAVRLFHLYHRPRSSSNLLFLPTMDSQTAHFRRQNPRIQRSILFARREFFTGVEAGDYAELSGFCKKYTEAFD